MTLVVLSVSHRTADLEVVGRLARMEADRPDVLAEIESLPGVRQAGVLVTCNRVEVLCDSVAPELTATAVRRLLQARSGLPLHDEVEVHHGREAARHLFRVASGLESLAVGEQEIRGQVRRCVRQMQERASGGHVDRALQHALQVARRVHLETTLSHESRSLLAAATDLAGQDMGSVAGRRALVVGAGTYARLVVTELAAAGCSITAVVSRSLPAAAALAARVGGEGTDLRSLGERLSGVDLAVFVTGAPGAVLSADVAQQVMQRRRGRPLLLVDLALPRDVEPAAGAVPGVRLLDLRAVGHSLSRQGGSALAAAEALVERSVEAYAGRWDSPVPSVLAPAA